MSKVDIFLTYFGVVALALMLIYSTKNYWITLIAGFIAFCVFYFSYGITDFKWEISPMLQYLKEAAIIYIISFVIAVIIYKIAPPGKKQQTPAV
jgi:ABC-type Fe3+-siderophore transport system permease subunit